MLHFDYDITNLRGATYNPREISDADLEKLGESIRKLGLVKPIIARHDLIVAGHQRTKALRRIGINRAPVYLLSTDTTVYDETRFNQLHNGTDMDGGDENCVIKDGFEKTGYQVVEPARITGNFRSKLCNVRSEICNLILKYGPWGGVVATMSGKVIHAAQYALAAALTRTPLTTYVIADADEAKYRAFLDRGYGVFSYDHLEKKTFIQTLAQPHRLREGGKSRRKDGQPTGSQLYENMVIPFAKQHKGDRYIDFGSGHGDMARKMRADGYSFHDVELFRRAGAAHAIDLTAVNLMIDVMVADLHKYGPYDAVACDSVVNSVDSMAAESAVMTMLNALTKKGGRCFFSGRRREWVEQHDRATIQTDVNSHHRTVEFVDKHGFSALFRSGRWFYQKFHYKHEIPELAERFGFKIITQRAMTGWMVEAEKVRDLPIEEMLKAAEFEFNILVSDDMRLGRHNDVMNAIKEAYAN